MVYKLINYYKPRGMLAEHAGEEFVNHEPLASDLRFLLVFYQHPMWFFSLQTIETCGLLLTGLAAQ